MKVLHVDASVRFENSTSRELSAYFLAELERSGVPLDVDRLDLARNAPQPLGPIQTAAMYVPIEEHSKEMTEALAESNGLVDRVLAADALVLGVPVYNFGMPAAFKAFVDNISRSGRTFSYAETGRVRHLSNTKVAVLESAGGNYRGGAMFDGLDCLPRTCRPSFGFSV